MKIRICTAFYSEFEMVKPLVKELKSCKEHEFIFTPYQGSELSWLRNMHFTDGKDCIADYDAFLIFDSDQYTPASTVYKMIEHDKDVIVAPYESQFMPNYYNCGELDEIGNIKYRYAKNETGFKPIGYSSEGCMLIKRHVLEDIFKKFKTLAFFGTDYYINRAGIEKGRSLDFRFCKLIREAGYQIWCDFDLKVEHRIRKEKDFNWKLSQQKKEPRMEQEKKQTIPNNLLEAKEGISKISSSMNDIYVLARNEIEGLHGVIKSKDDKIVSLEKEIKLLKETKKEIKKDVKDN